MIRKKILAAVLTMTLLAGTAAASAFAAGGTPLPLSSAPQEDARPGSGEAPSDPGAYSLQVNGVELEESACLMIPLFPVARELGFTVTQQEDGSVLVDTGDIHTVVMPGVDRYQITTSHTGMVGMSAPFSFGMAPYISQENVYVPLGLIDALLNGQGDSVTVSGNSIAIQDAG